jgi:hypothetical protein
MKAQYKDTGCKHHPDCSTCPYPECKLYRYPQVAPAGLHEVIKVYKGLLDKPATKDKHNWAINKIMRLRRQKKYQLDKQRARQRIMKLIEGYGRREAEKRIESIKPKAWVVDAVSSFARDHPLDKNHPMPLGVAFEELFYKRPRLGFPLYTGLWGVVKNGNVFLDDGKTRAPQSIARLVKYKLRGDDNEYTRCVRVVYAFWAITKEPPLSHKP